MKKAFLLVINSAFCLNLLACGAALTADNNSKPSISQQETQIETKQEIKIGDKIITNDTEITINNVEFTYDVIPDDTSRFYNSFEAGSGKVYICVDTDVTNKSRLIRVCDEIGKVIADYNDGYTYTGFAIAEYGSLGLQYANTVNIYPLETMGIRWLIECPQEVEDDKAPLFLEFTIGGEEFIYTIR